MMQNKYYYTLEDFIRHYSDSNDFNSYYDVGKVITGALTNLASEITTIAPADLTGLPVASLEANTLWCKYIVGKFKDYAVFVDDTDTFSNIKAYQWFTHFMVVLNKTYTRYKTLISDYATQESHLLDKLNSSNSTKFNDTPQNGGSYDDDNHISTITNSSSTTDIGTAASRLEEIRQNWIDVYTHWSTEFTGLFIPC